MGIINFLKIILLGIVEGFTEWLPISSTGHLLLFDSFLKLDVTEQFWNVFLVIIQFGASLAVIALFWKKLWPFTKDPENYYLKVPVVALWIKIIVACVPAIVVGLLFNDFINNVLYTKSNAPFIVGTMLIIYGIVFLIFEHKQKDIQPKYNRISKMPLKVVAYLGLFQLLAIIPGTSRPGAIIIGALLLGCNRTTAIEFSVYLGVPVMFGASLLKMVSYTNKYGAFTGDQIVMLMAGCISAFVVSILVIRSVLGFVQNHDFKPFGYYRIAVGFIVISCFIFI